MRTEAPYKKKNKAPQGRAPARPPEGKPPAGTPKKELEEHLGGIRGLEARRETEGFKGEMGGIRAEERGPTHPNPLQSPNVSQGV